jgi:hypothetical protein
MHELACVSGIAAAFRLGAEYVKFDDFAEDFFSKYLLLSHGVRYGAEGLGETQPISGVPYKQTGNHDREAAKFHRNTY